MTARIPDRQHGAVGDMRWCNGPCGRELHVTAFPIDGHGRRYWRCRLCRNLRRRQRWKQPKVRRRLLAAHHNWYVLNAAVLCAKQRRRYWANRDETCRKQRERYRLRRARPTRSKEKEAA